MTDREPKPEKLDSEKLDVPAPARTWRDHTAMCRLLDSPARKRGWPFICICGADKP